MIAQVPPAPTRPAGLMGACWAWRRNPRPGSPHLSACLTRPHTGPAAPPRQDGLNHMSSGGPQGRAASQAAPNTYRPLFRPQNPLVHRTDHAWLPSNLHTAVATSKTRESFTNAPYCPCRLTRVPARQPAAWKRDFQSNTSHVHSRPICGRVFPAQASPHASHRTSPLRGPPPDGPWASHSTPHYTYIQSSQWVAALRQVARSRGLARTGAAQSNLQRRGGQEERPGKSRQRRVARCVGVVTPILGMPPAAHRQRKGSLAAAQAPLAAARVRLREGVAEDLPRTLGGPWSRFLKPWRLAGRTGLGATAGLAAPAHTSSLCLHLATHHHNPAS